MPYIRDCVSCLNNLSVKFPIRMVGMCAVLKVSKNGVTFNCHQIIMATLIVILPQKVLVTQIPMHALYIFYLCLERMTGRVTAECRSGRGVFVIKTGPFDLMTKRSSSSEWRLCWWMVGQANEEHRMCTEQQRCWEQQLPIAYCVARV